jgi:hypothetical protein
MNNILKEYNIFKDNITKYKINNKLECIHHVQLFLQNVFKSVSIEDKIKEIRNLFSYIYVNKWFLQENYLFAVTVKNKLIELHKIHKWEALLTIYYSNIFDDNNLVKNKISNEQQKSFNTIKFDKFDMFI